ncbi:MAG: RNA polymerase factor sigma-54 [Methylobacillus sp.]|jgi:RNA polymerase sigma-54 factor|nr:RNA polymerase factor sigma-54 [Methylobacillus sp.]
MKPSLQLRISQHLTLTPQMQQSIRLLQLSAVELNQELETMLQANPLLERVDHDEGDKASIPDAAPEEMADEEILPQGDFNAEPLTDYADFGSSRHREEDDNDDEDYHGFQESSQPTLCQYLLEQLQLMPLSERDWMLASIIVDAINEDGYLDQPLEELAAMLPPEKEIDNSQEINLLELQTTLKLIQHLGPPGTGARDLAECLGLQLAAMPETTPHRAIAMELVKHHLNVLASRDYVRLRKLLRCDDETLRAAQQLIIRLNPRPGAGFSHIPADQYIQHEVVVKKVKGVWLAALNQEVIPRLRINQLYADILRRNRDNSSQVLMSQMQEAKWMIKNIQQRFSTILRVSQAVVDRQRNFFEHGEIAMRPLVMREIADEVGLHESTVSRITTRKYMLTPRGVRELKYFFGSHVATESGGACSATAIRALIRQLVNEENPKKPLSDGRIAEILGQQGIVVARRTIAKYRESLQIPPTSQRKSL